MPTPKTRRRHQTSVRRTWTGGYQVKCSDCGNLGRFGKKEKFKAEHRARIHYR